MARAYSKCKLDELAYDVIRRGILTRRSDADLAKQLGVSAQTIYKTRKRLREETAQRLVDTDAMFRESLERYEEYEQMALERGSIREARENRTAIVRLLGLAKGDAQGVAHTYVHAPQISHTEIVIVEPQAAAVPPAEAVAALPEPEAMPLSVGQVLPFIVEPAAV